MNIETLLTILIVAVVVASIIRSFAGWSLASWLLSFVVAMFGAVAGWLVERQLRLPPIYTFPFPTDRMPVSVVWASAGAFALTLLVALIARPARRAPVRSTRTRRSR